MQQFPETVGKYTRRLDICQGDQPNFVDLRASTIEFIESVGDIVGEVKDFCISLFEDFHPTLARNQIFLAKCKKLSGRCKKQRARVR